MILISIHMRRYNNIPPYYDKLESYISVLFVFLAINQQNTLKQSFFADLNFTNHENKIVFDTVCPNNFCCNSQLTMGF